jgi:hypothetical protein
MLAVTARRGRSAIAASGQGWPGVGNFCRQHSAEHPQSRALAANRTLSLTTQNGAVPPRSQGALRRSCHQRLSLARSTAGPMCPGWMMPISPPSSCPSSLPPGPARDPPSLVRHRCGRGRRQADGNRPNLSQGDGQRKALCCPVAQTAGLTHRAWRGRSHRHTHS